MPNLKRVTPALIALIGAFSGMPARAEMTHVVGDHLGALRTPFGQFSQGLDLSLTESLNYDSNIVRTENGDENFSLYGTRNSSDWVSQTGVNATYNYRNSRTQVTFVGDGGYAKYFNYSQFSGWVARGNASWIWNFTNRCSSTVEGRAERRLADFAETNTSQSTFQTDLAGTANVGCFLIETVRLSAGVFGETVKNDNDFFQVNNLNQSGYEASAALVSAHHDEIGIHYRSSKTRRPDDPNPFDDIDDTEYDAYITYAVGHSIHLYGSGGFEHSKRGDGSHEDRSTGYASVGWNPTVRIAADLSYNRSIDNVPDLIATTEKSDSINGDVHWKLGSRVTTGAYATYRTDELDQGFAGFLTGVKEHEEDFGVYLQHTLFQMISVKWNAGYINRHSGFALRSFDSAAGGVSLGFGF